MPRPSRRPLLLGCPQSLRRTRATRARQKAEIGEWSAPTGTLSFPTAIDAPTSPRSFASEARETLKLALPVAAGQLGQILLHFCDALFAGRLGVVPLAAASFATSIMSVAYVMTIGTLTAIAVQAAHAHGEKNRHEAGEILRHGLFLALGVALVAVVVIEIIGFHLDRFGQVPEVEEQARGFLRLLGLSIIPAALWQALKQFSEAVGDPLPPMYAAFAGIPLNLLLCWMFMFGGAGMPQLGLAGAGLATLITRVVLAAGLALYVFRGMRLREEAMAGDWRARPSWTRLRSLLGLGLPVALQLLMEVSVFSAAAIMIGWFGAAPLAAHNIAITCAATTFMIPLGLSLAVSVRIAQVSGAGAHERILRVGWSAFAMGGGVMAFSALIFTFSGDWLARWFTTDPAVIALAATLLGVAGVFQIADGLQVVGMGVLRGLKDVRVPALIAFAAYWVLALPACWYLGYRLGWGARGVWWGLALGLATAALVLAWRFERLASRRSA